MHENRHFLSYRKRRHDAENRTTSLWGVAAKWLVATGQPTWKKFQFESPRMNLRRHCWAFVYVLLVISSFSNLVRCVAFQSFSFCLLQLSFTTAGPYQGACLLLGVLFYFPSLSLFVSSHVKICSFQFNRLAISWPSWVRVWGWASYYWFLPFTVFFSWLALLFLKLYRSFTMYE